MNSIVEEQMNLCKRYNAVWVPSDDGLKLGISPNVRSGLRPLNGLRHPQQGDTTGWYIWAGEELSSAPDFFQPIHVSHIREWCPELFRFLGLPPGWRFLVDGDYLDVWYDAKLLNV
jgi:hypothetical protein